MSRTARSVLYGVTLGVLLALLLAPQSGWLVRFQTLSLLRFGHLPGYGLDGITPAEQRRMSAVAASHSSDYQLQYAATSFRCDMYPWDVAALRALGTRFPNSASLHANIIRLACTNQFFLDRKESDLFVQMPVTDSKIKLYGTPRNEPKQLDAFDRDAAAGERLDPGNAYFPLMRAVGLYIRHQDAAARAAILRAGTKTQWKEYYDDEVAGQTRLHALAFGDRSAFWHTAIAASVLLPHYGLLRQMFRVATYQAMRDERAGNVREGVALRHALIHCGDLMRAQSQANIGSLVGIAIAQTAMQRPDGSPWVNEYEPDNAATSLMLTAINASYAAYLRRVGQDAEAHYALTVGAANRQAAAVLSTWNSFIMPVYEASFLHLIWCWIASLTLLTVIPWLLLLRVLSAGLSHTPVVLAQRPLPGWASWGAAAGVLAALGVLLLTMLIMFADWDGFSAGLTTILLFLVVALPFLLLLRAQHGPFQRRSVGRGLGVAALTCGGLCGAYVLSYWQFTEPQNFIRSMGILTGDEGSGAAGSSLPWQIFAPLVVLAVPLLLVVTLALVSRIRRIPMFAGLVYGCRAVCLPLACVLLLAYGAVTLVTLHQERIVNDILTKRLHGEGAYLATRTGQVWPGVVP